MGKPKASGKSGKSNFKSSKKEGGGFTDVRKKKAINSYKKLLRKEKRVDTLHEVIKRQKDKKAGVKIDTFAKVNKEAEEKKKKIEADKIRQKEEREARAKEIEENKAAAAERRKRRQKLFGKKTRKGQPNLNNQMTLLLEKIEGNTKNSTSNLNTTSSSSNS